MARTYVASLVVALLIAPLLGAGCELDEPAVADKYNQYELFTASAVTEDSPERILNGVVALMDDAQTRIWVAFEDLTELAVAESLIRASQRGVDVRVVGEADSSEQAGFRRLEEEFAVLNELPSGNASLPAPGTIRYADGPTIHTPEPGTDIVRPGELNLMSHNFVLIDETTVINLSGGFPDDWRDKIQIGFLASSQDLTRDFEDEFRQLIAGVDATTPSAFNGPLKSTADGRFIYPGNIAEFELYFGPQERTAKRVLDHIFGAKSSVWIATESLSNEFVCKALIYKMRTAFDVRLVLAEPIDPRPVRSGEESACAQLVTEFSADNPIGDGYVHELRYEPNLAVNMVIVDRLPGRLVETKQTLAYVMSQPLLAALTFVEGNIGDPPTPLAADTFADANVWLVREFPSHPEPAIDELARRFTAIFEGAQP